MIKNTLQTNENIQPNDRQMTALREHFATCFSADGSFDIERFKAEISDKTNVTQEGYELRFLGKSYAKLLASTDTTTIIQPNETHNAQYQNANSQNIYISGDNLDGLKHLLKSYQRSIKCIYIDPPYNTGSDGFVYQDNFNYTKDTLQEKLSVSEDEAQRILDLTKRGSASHSAWLMFMYSRLLLARDLLTDDGVIFISIDDNEQANLKLLCDDIFGEENFVGVLVWEKKKKGSFLNSSITNIKEYIFIYAKNQSLFNGLTAQIVSDEETYPCINPGNSISLRTIPKGVKSNFNESEYRLENGSVISAGNMSIKLHSDLVIKDGKLAEDVIMESEWRYSMDSMNKYAENDELYLTNQLYIRRIVRELRYKKLKDILPRIDYEKLIESQENLIQILKESKHNQEEIKRLESDIKILENSLTKINIDDLYFGGWGSNEDGDEELRTLLERKVFDFPKPTKLIIKLLASLYKQDATILDFFSGSGTTAHAVMQLNAEDGGSRRFIAVQLPEVLDAENPSQKAAYDFLQENKLPTTLDYIGIERIRRAAAKIKAENPGKALDLGFRHYILAEPTQNTLDKLETFDATALLVDTSVLDDFGKPTILATWLNADGYGLTAQATAIDLAGYTAYHYDKHLYLIDGGFTLESMKTLLSKYDAEGRFNPQNLVLFGYSFPDWSINEMLEKNLRILNDSEKNLKVNLSVRY